MKIPVKLLVSTALILQLVYLVYRLIWTIPYHFTALSLILGFILFLAEVTANFQRISELIYGLAKKEKPSPPKIPADYFPDIDVLIMTHDEDTLLLEKTLNGCQTLNYPDKRKIHIYICDDTNRPEVKQLASVFNIGYIGIDKEANPNKKAGNINNALKQTSSPLIALLDSDMISKSNFLEETVPYFYDVSKTKFTNVADYNKYLADHCYDYRLAFLQTAQDFYTLDLFQYNLFAEKELPAEQAYFFKTLNPNRTNFNAPIYCGSNAILSRKALDSINGISYDSITEDVSTGIQLVKQGYLAQAIPESYLYGMTPTTIEGIKNQQERWARGFFQSLRANKILTNREMGLKTKLAYLQSLNYWLFPFRKLLFTCIPMSVIFFKLPIVVGNPKIFLLVWGIRSTLYVAALKKISDNQLIMSYHNIIEHILAPLIIIGLTKEIIGVKKQEFIITPKKFVADTQHWLGIKMSMLFCLFLNIVAVSLLYYYFLVGVNLISVCLLGYWLVQNIILTIFTLSFFKKRPNFEENSAMWELNFPLKIMGKMYRTEKMNESCLYIKNQPQAIEPNKEFAFTISDERYTAQNLIGVYTGKIKQDLFEIKIKNYNGAYHDYLNILHDRDKDSYEKIQLWKFWTKAFWTNLKHLTIGNNSQNDIPEMGQLRAN